MAADSYDVREVPVSPRAVAGIRAFVPRGQVPKIFGQYLDQVYAAGRNGSVALDGQDIFIYRDAVGEQMTVDFCVGVKEPFAGAGLVLPLETPTGVAAMTTHVGDYGGIANANAAILEWCRAH